MDEVAEVKSRLEITEVVGAYVPLKQAGRNLKAPCPFHQEKSASFMVSPEKGIYARGDMLCEAIRAMANSPLVLDPNWTPERHVNVLGWPDNDTDQKSLAQALSDMTKGNTFLNPGYEKPATQTA